MILPGYMMRKMALTTISRLTDPSSVTALLEIFEEAKVPGVVRLVSTLVYTIFFSAGLSMGSAFFFAAYPAAKHNKDSIKALAAGTVSIVSTFGNFTVPQSNQTLAGFHNGTFMYMNDTLIETAASHFIEGCYRDTSWEWYKQPMPFKSLFALVPAFALFISLANHQHPNSTIMLANVVASCISFAANKAATTYIAGAPPGFAGALVVGIIGHLSTRLWRKSAFPIMATAVLFIVPVRIIIQFCQDLELTGALT
jgi:uncharacterized membrane protein YjjB (DUF3815 family)